MPIVPGRSEKGTRFDHDLISLVVGSTRQGFSEKPARRIFQHFQKRDGIDAQLLDRRGLSHALL